MPMNNSTPHISYALEQFRLNDGYPDIYVGYLWSADFTEPPPIVKSQADELSAAAEERNLDETEPGWLRWGNMPWDAQTKPFCLQMARDPEVIMRDTIDVLWELFEATHETAEELNRLLAEDARSGSSPVV